MIIYLVSKCGQRKHFLASINLRPIVLLTKILTESVITKFKIDSEYLQHNIIFVIDGVDYQAIARMVVMDRSNQTSIRKKNLLQG